MMWRDVERIMLPPWEDPVTGRTRYPHITFNEDGSRNTHGWRLKDGEWKWHPGVDINYEGGQIPINLNHPPVNTPVCGKVERVDVDWGIVEIRDHQGNLHRFRHLDEVSIKEGDDVFIGDQIGTEGGRGDKNKDGIPTANEYEHHLHYEVYDFFGREKNPVAWWNGLPSDSVVYQEFSEWFIRTYNNDPQDLIRIGLEQNYLDWFIRAYFNVPQSQSIRAYFGNAKTAQSPLILDLDGDGIETTPINDGTYFDHDGNGFAEQTGLTWSDDGILVWDRNNDGRINDGIELFGDQTLLKNGSRAANGFQALAEWDDNADGKVDANDAIWSNLKVWQDYGEDGISSPDELWGLSDLGIASMSTGRRGISPGNLQHLT